MAFRPPFPAMFCSSTAGGMREPLRKPGMVTCFDTSVHTLSYAACVAVPGTTISTKTALCSSRVTVAVGAVLDCVLSAYKGPERCRCRCVVHPTMELVLLDENKVRGEDDTPIKACVITEGWVVDNAIQTSAVVWNFMLIMGVFPRRMGGGFGIGTLSVSKAWIPPV